VLRPLHDRSGGGDGFVSVELAPALAHHTEASVAAARTLHRRIGAPSLLVKIPATAEGVAAVRQATAEGLSINVTLLFGLDRYEQVIEAYLQGLEAHPGDLSRVHSVASFGETFTSPRSSGVAAGQLRLPWLVPAGRQSAGRWGPSSLSRASATLSSRSRISGKCWSAQANPGLRVTMATGNETARAPQTSIAAPASASARPPRGRGGGPGVAWP
jgi:Transaldolase/Fructose-6-phosphate aldolase